MFSQVSVCPQWRGVHPLIPLGRHPSLGRYPLGRHPLGRHPLADTPRQTLYPLGRHLPWTDTLYSDPPLPRDDHCRGWYASYWNAYGWMDIIPISNIGFTIESDKFYLLLAIELDIRVP